MVNERRGLAGGRIRWNLESQFLELFIINEIIRRERQSIKNISMTTQNVVWKLTESAITARMTGAGGDHSFH